LPEPVTPIKTTIIHFTPYSCHLKIDSVQSIEYISVQEVSQPKTLLSLEVRVNFVDDVAYACLQSPVETGRSLHHPGDSTMATIATATPGKTSFVKQFLNDHPDGTTKTVNEAWQAAGMKGTISHPIISQVRKQLGLTGKLRGKIRAAAKGKAAPNMPKTATTPGKTSFVKDFL